MKYSGDGGFTLLEVLIALALLAILMAGLIKITADNTKNLWYLENKTIAATVAANHAVQLRLDTEKPENQDGWEAMAGRRWYWQAKRGVTPSIGGAVWDYRIEVFLEGDKSPYAGLLSYVPVGHEQ
ncbi:MULTISPECIES: type II secretion system minor pseudopilin GspI [Methylomonas]|uniref:Type II secretion system protein I n=2 Tax=Methylomonas TaxID=416 RepID=A0A126T8B5_9GAMM|nr:MULTISPECIES: type II secretion system minor pseudopilin GspI [Methylomonas]AMK78333.1 type II secretion system protein GspI [Methylomonas denitrificans]OAI04046.1 type II secretion system protein GspI [Methylomonas methanica]TCV87636.1 type II secretion system protein I (GspI) [Methylomonas methanica]